MCVYVCACVCVCACVLLVMCPSMWVRGSMSTGLLPPCRVYPPLPLPSPHLLVCFGKLEGAGEERPAPVADAWCLMGHDNAARTKALTNVPPCIAPHHLWCRLITTIAVACVVIITVIPRTGLLVGTARCSGSCSSKAGLLTVGVELFYGVEVSRNQRLSTRGPWELQHKGAESRAMWQWGAEEQGGVAKIVRGCSCVHGCPP